MYSHIFWLFLPLLRVWSSCVSFGGFSWVCAAPLLPHSALRLMISRLLVLPLTHQFCLLPPRIHCCQWNSHLNYLLSTSEFALFFLVREYSQIYFSFSLLFSFVWDSVGSVAQAGLECRVLLHPHCSSGWPWMPCSPPPTASLVLGLQGGATI